MRLSMLYRVLVGFMFTIALAECGGSGEGTPAVFQSLSFTDAGDLAAREQKIVLVDYTASWCPPCRMMERDTWPDQDVVAWIDEHAIAIQVDVDENRKLAGEHQITAMPTMIVFRDGEEIARTVGYRDPSQLLAWLKDVAG